MLAHLLLYLNSVDWTDETILKAVKDLGCRNIILDEFERVVIAHERLYKLLALVKNDDMN